MSLGPGSSLRKPRSQLWARPPDPIRSIWSPSPSPPARPNPSKYDSTDSPGTPPNPVSFQEVVAFGKPKGRVEPNFTHCPLSLFRPLERIEDKALGAGGPSELKTLSSQPPPPHFILSVLIVSNCPSLEV